MSIPRSDRKFLEHQRSVERSLNRQVVRIVNPHPGGKTHLKLAVAIKHVEAGTAEFRCDGTAIEFLGHRYISAVKSIEADRLVHARIGSPEQRIPVVRMRELFAPSPRRGFAWEKAVYRDTRPVIGPFGETAAQRRMRAMQKRASEQPWA